MHQRGPALVRIALSSLVFGALALALVQPAQAGTEAAPEIQDPADDQALLGQVDAMGAFGGNSDITAGWVTETATEVHLFIKSSGDFTPGTAGAYTFTFHLTIAGTEYTANLTTAAPTGGSATAGGVATAVAIAGSIADLTVPKANLGNPAAGATATGLFINSAGGAPVPQVPLAQDRAPNSGSGLDYVFKGGGPGGNVTAGDTDGDGLNDTCERKYFGNLTATNDASADPDGDGLTNGQECALGTDPTKADTDGDGVKDKDDPFPTDPTKGGASSGSGSHSGSGSSSGSRSGSGSGSASGSGSRASSSTGTEDDGVHDVGDAVQKLKDDIGYLGTSAGGLIAVLILAILALAVRWSL